MRASFSAVEMDAVLSAQHQGAAPDFAPLRSAKLVSFTVVAGRGASGNNRRVLPSAIVKTQDKRIKANGIEALKENV